MFMWIVILIGAIGTLLNAKKKRIGFIFWIISNTAIALHNIAIFEYEQATLFFFYLGMAIYGFFYWRDKK